MTKIEFLLAIETRIRSLSEEERKRTLDYYDEMIDDRMEDGTEEAEAVAEIGSPETIAAQILSETPRPTVEKKRRKPKMGGWTIALLILGFPVWLPLLAAGAAVIFAVYAVLWSVIASLYAADLSFAVAAFGGTGVSVVYMVLGNLPGAGFLLGAALLCGGLAVLLFLGTNEAARGIWRLSKGIIRLIFVRREAAE